MPAPAESMLDVAMTTSLQRNAHGAQGISIREETLPKSKPFAWRLVAARTSDFMTTVNVHASSR